MCTVHIPSWAVSGFSKLKLPIISICLHDPTRFFLAIEILMCHCAPPSPRHMQAHVAVSSDIFWWKFSVPLVTLQQPSYKSFTYFQEQWLKVNFLDNTPTICTEKMFKFQSVSVSSSRFKVQSSSFMSQVQKFQVWGLRFEVQSSMFQVLQSSSVLCSSVFKC